MIKKLLNNIFAVFVIVIVLAIVIPLPTTLIDFFLIINVSLAVIILLMTMYIKETLEFSIFPSILLITTVFRLALTISTTRLILTNAATTGETAAGNVIATYGNFVMGGNAVVGFIVFIIIVITNFLVITKGSERVSEVAARFTLDAMPGKQMAIDADLNTGAITDEEAKIRRSKIQREADFFGAMDGATKFVKGDAIMSIITALVNLIAGGIIGMVMYGMTFGDVTDIYFLLTVGDGLASMIPALMISTATGMVVTRAGTEGSFNFDVRRQFTQNPTIMYIAGMTVLALMALPGFPRMILFLIGTSLIIFGYMISRMLKRQEIENAVLAEQVEMDEMEAMPANGSASEEGYYRNIDNVFKLLNVEQIEMEFGYSLLHLVDEKSGGSTIERVVLFRKQFATEMGMVFPSVRMRNNPEINPNQYLIKIKGEEVTRGEILTDHYLAIDNGDVVNQVEGIDTIEPAFGIPARWISEDKKVVADVAGYTLIDPVSVMITHLSEVVRTHCHEILSRQDVKTMVENMKESNPAVVEDLIPSIVSIGYLQKVLCMLLKEGIPIRDMETILESLAENVASLKDIDIAVEYVRQALKRTITRRFAEANSLRVITLDPRIEDTIIANVKKSDRGSYLALDPDTIQEIMAVSTEEINKVRDVIPQVIVLTSPIVRVYYKKLVEQFIPGITVLSYNEIDSIVQIQSIGNITLGNKGLPGGLPSGMDSQGQ
ncbi:MAG: flagellar biosynthesis protein FlhA [Oscillospiraceae bacterium]|nr:flagellar biosynthesis protein FlhA [Oscillospiraceae bacterium]